MKSIRLFVFPILTLLLFACSGGDPNGEDPNQPTNTNSAASTAAPTDVFFLNLAMSLPGERVEISRGRPAPFSGDRVAQLREDFNLGGRPVFTVMGGNFNVDGNAPAAANEMSVPYQDTNGDGTDNRNHSIVNFIIADDFLLSQGMRANAQIIVDTPFSTQSKGQNLWGDIIIGIESGDIRITSDEPLFDGSNATELIVSDIDNTLRDYNNFSQTVEASERSVTNPDFVDSTGEIRDLFSENVGGAIPIILIETGFKDRANEDANIKEFNLGT